jgi:hypothetical protein
VPSHHYTKTLQIIERGAIFAIIGQTPAQANAMPQCVGRIACVDMHLAPVHRVNIHSGIISKELETNMGSQP